MSSLPHTQATTLSALFGALLLRAIPRPAPNDPLAQVRDLPIVGLQSILAATRDAALQDRTVARVNVELLRGLGRALRPADGAQVAVWTSIEEGLTVCAEALATSREDIAAALVAHALELATSLQAAHPTLLGDPLPAPPVAPSRPLKVFYFAWTIPTRGGVTRPRAALRTDANGRFLGSQTDAEHADRWYRVRGASVSAARAKFERGEVESAFGA